MSNTLANPKEACEGLLEAFRLGGTKLTVETNDGYKLLVLTGSWLEALRPLLAAGATTGVLDHD